MRPREHVDGTVSYKRRRADRTQWGPFWNPPMHSLRVPGSAADARRDQRNALLALLIRRAAAGEVAAFKTLYDTTAPWLLARVRGIVGEVDAEDVLTEAYLQVWRSLKDFDQARGEPLSWLAAIARSRALDRLRHERSRRGTGPHVDCDDAASELVHEADPESCCARRQASEALHASIQQLLSEREKMVLRLAYFRECSHTEISVLTGMPVGTVKTLLHRSHRKLRDGLAGAVAADALPGHAVG